MRGFSDGLFRFCKGAWRDDDGDVVDIVEVVRCKDCKFSGMYCFGASHEPTFACLDIEEDGFIGMAIATEPDGYCCNGERKDDE